MGQINLLRFIENYGDVYRFADYMLAMRDELTGMRAYEADTALLVSTIGFVFDVHHLFARPIDDENPEHCFEELGVLLDLERGLPTFDLMVKQLREGVRYDKVRRRWIREPRLIPQPNCISVTEWGRFQGFDMTEQLESHERCKSLVSHLCGEGRERFCAALVADRMHRELQHVRTGA